MRTFALILGLSALAGAQDLTYGTGTWNADSLGNHRFVLRVDAPASFVTAHIPWRRRDAHPEQKHAFIVDSATSSIVTQYRWTSISRGSGNVEFVPTSGAGTYYVYYLLYRPRGSRNYPKGYYLPFQPGDTSFLRPGVRAGTAHVVGYESIDSFNTFWPMEFISSSAETRRLVQKHERDPFLLFVEPRERPIRMMSDLPMHWTLQGPQRTLTASADRGEFLSFQVGIFAARRPINIAGVTSSSLKGPNGATIASSALTCFNTNGIDWRGRPFSKEVRVDSGNVQALWMGVQIPQSARPGVYRGTVTIEPSNAEPQDVSLEIAVSDHVLADAGDREPARLSRLRWLNSQLAADDSVVQPFTPIRVSGREISILGRAVELTPNGLPAQVRSYFSPENTRLLSSSRPLLTAPMRFVVEDGAGRSTSWVQGQMQFRRQTPGTVAWSSAGSVGDFDATLEGSLECDGYVEYRLTLTARRRTSVRDMRLEIPWEQTATRYMMGLGRKGGFRPDRFTWAWDQKKNHDAVWLGDINAGMQLSLRDSNYVRPLNTNFYLLKPLQMPASWFNGGAGGLQFAPVDTTTLLVEATSGARSLAPGESVHFIWSLLITPFKLIDTDAQWSTRYYHRLDPLDTIVAAGANTINVHHANAVNPYINYPFLSPDTMRAFAAAAHARGMRMKIYYTVRELTNRAPEMPMLFSLGDEVLEGGAGGGFAWLQEHLDQDYIPAWFVPELKDAAVINSGVSRWHNFYVEGLDWLVRNVGIDGLYIDDVAFDRTTMKRVRKTLERHRPAPLIDLHSANQFNPRDGYVNSANLYLEHFPYLDRLWFGEYFDYDAQPDFWMVEVSGIPFGLMGEMLEKGGNPWRGMIYGMTNRLPWAGDPRPVWKIWDAFGMAGSDMVGYWSPACPVQTGHPDVKATVYRKPGSALIAVASWASDTVGVTLAVDWKSLGIDKRAARIEAMEASGFQPAHQFAIDEPIPCPPGKGWLLHVVPDTR